MTSLTLFTGHKSGIHYDVLDKVRYLKSDLIQIAQQLSNSARVTDIGPFSSGAFILEALHTEGSVTARMFFEWWLTEDAFLRLESFMESHFNNKASLLERSGIYSSRFHINRDDSNPDFASSDCASALSGEEGLMYEEEMSFKSSNSNELLAIFSTIESHKLFLQIEEYSVGQTTLEQIFNQFATESNNSDVSSKSEPVNL